MSNFKGLKNRLGPQLDQRTRRVRKPSDAGSTTSEASAHNASINRFDSQLSIPSASTPLSSSQISLNSEFEGSFRALDNGHIAASISELPTDQSDVESVASEDPLATIRGSQLNLSSLSEEELKTAYLKSNVRLQKYKTRLKTAFNQNDELHRESSKLKQLLETSQDKHMKKISELKETAALDKEAKVHMEQTLQAEIDEKNLILESLNTKVSLLKGSLKSDSDENSKLQNLTHEVSQQKDTILAYESSIDGYKLMIQEISGELDVKSNIVNELQLQLESSSATFSKISSQLEQRNTALQSFLSSLNSYLPDLCPNFDEEASISISVNAAFQRLKETQDGDVEDSIQKVKDVSSQLSNEKRQLENEVKTLRSSVTAMSSMSEKLTSEFNALKTSHAEETTKRQQVETDLKFAEQMLNECNIALKASHSEATSRKQEAENELKNSQQLLNDYSSEISDLKKIIEMRTEEAARASERLQAIQSSSSDSNSQLSEQIKHLSEEQLSLQSTIRSNEGELSTLSESVKDREDRVNQLLTVVEDLNKLVHQKSELAEGLQGEVEQLESEKTRLCLELEQLQRTYADSNVQLSEQMKQLTEEQSRLQSTIQTNDCDLSKLEESLKDRDFSVAQLSTEVENLNKLVNQKSGLAEDLQREVERLEAEKTRLSLELEQLPTNSKEDVADVSSFLVYDEISAGRIEDLENTINILKNENLKLSDALLSNRGNHVASTNCVEKKEFKSPDEIDVEEDYVMTSENSSNCLAAPSNESVLHLSNSRESQAESPVPDAHVVSHMHTSTPVKHNDSQEKCVLMSCSNDKKVLTAELTDVQAKMESLLCEIDSLSRVSSEKTELESRIVSLQDENATLSESMSCVINEKELRIAKMTEELSDISQQVTCKTNEIETLSQLLKNQCSTEEYESCALENVEVKRKFFQLQQDIATLKESSAIEKDKAVNALELQLNDHFNKEVRLISNEKTELATKFESSLKENSQLLDKLKVLEKNEAAAKSELDQITDTLNAFKSKLKTLESQLCEKTTELLSMVPKSTHDDLVSSCENLERKLTSLQLEHDASVEQFTAERNSFTNKIAELENSFLDANENAAKLTQLLEQYQSSSEDNFNRLSTEFTASEASVQLFQQKCEASEAQINDLSTKLASTQKKLKEMSDLLEQTKIELDSRQQELVVAQKLRTELEESLTTSKKETEDQKLQFTEYKKKVEDKFALERQKIQAKFKTKDEKIKNITDENEVLKSDIRNLKEDVSSKEDVNCAKIEENTQLLEQMKMNEKQVAQLKKSVGQLKEEKQLLIDQHNENIRSVESRMMAEVDESRTLLNSTLEQSQMDAENLQKNHQGQVDKLNEELQNLRQSLVSGLEEKQMEAHVLVENLQSELKVKDNLVGEYKLAIEELKCSEKVLKDEYDNERLRIESEYTSERRKSKDEMKSLRQKLLDTEKQLEDLQKVFESFKLESDSNLKSSREQVDSLKATSKRDRLMKDREIKTQSEEIYKLKDTLQKTRARHSEETSDIKSKHAASVSSLEEELKNMKQTIETLKFSHDEMKNETQKEHNEYITRLSIEHEQAIKNLLLDQEQKASDNESEIVSRLNDSLEEARKTIADKNTEISSLKMEMTDLIFKHDSEISELNMNDYKQKFDELIISSKQEMRRLNVRFDSKMKAQETKTTEELRKYEKQLQEQKLIIANLEFELEDLDSNFRAERARNDNLAKDAKAVQKQSDLKALLDAKDAEIAELERKAAYALQAKDADHVEKMKHERHKIVNEMDDFYAEKQQSTLDGDNSGSGDFDAFQANCSVDLNQSQPAILSPTFSHGGSTNSLFEDPTQMQFLRHILKQFITGGEKMTMAKVLITLAKFDDNESKDILSAVKTQTSRWL